LDPLAIGWKLPSINHFLCLQLHSVIEGRENRLVRTRLLLNC
jgi:hypothetical protein